MLLGERIKILRIEKKLSQHDLSEIINVSQKAISLWESNRSQPKAEYIIKLAFYFSVSAGYLLGMEPDESGKKLKKEGFLKNNVEK